MKDTLIEGLKLIKHNTVFLAIILSGLIFGMFSEGFDRLWTPFLLDSFSFPNLWNLKRVVWFGILAMVANILGVIAVRFAEKKTDTNNHKSTVKTLLLSNSLLAISVIIFGLSRSFFVVAILYWLISMFREVRNPFYDAWVNQNANTKVRATVFSVCSQVNSVGQIVGGPILGLVATIISLRTSVIVAGLVLIPSLLIYNLSIKRHNLIEPAVS